MTKFNKSLLTAAVVGALALPGLASAASLAYDTNKQITFAKDLIVNNDTTIYVPSDLLLAATATDAANMATILANEEVRIKVTLTNGAKFDSTASAATLVAGFQVGTQLAAAAGAVTVVGTPYYSASGQELNFSIRATAIGNATLPGFAVRLNSMQITNLVTGLFDGSAIGAEITAQNQAGQQVLAAKATIAQSKWGLTYAGFAQDPIFGNAKIDVVGGGSGAAAFNRKTRFSRTGAVGGSSATATNSLWSPGGVTIDIAKALETGVGGVNTYINNYSAVAATPIYNVVSTSLITVKVTGSNLTSFASSAGAGGTTVQNTWLSTAADCSLQSVVHSAATPVVIDGGSISYSISGTNALVTSTIGQASPAPLNLAVCFQANGAREMVAQPLKGDVSVDYRLNTQRVNPPAGTFALKPLEQNGSNILFQNVNPAGNATAQSFLRVTNNNAFACPIVIDAKDDAGKHSGEVKFTLAAHESKQINSEVLEGAASAAGVTGGFGDGTGKWYVRVTAECDFVAGSALNRHQDGVVTDLTPAKFETWLTPDTKL